MNDTSFAHEEAVERGYEERPRYGVAKLMNDLELSTVSYIRQNWERDDRLAVVKIPRPDGEARQTIRTAEQIVLPAYIQHLREVNETGTDIFISMNSLTATAAGRKKSDIAEVRHVYLDLDEGGKTALRRVLESGTMPTPHHILQTSIDKYQLIWSVGGFAAPQAELLMRGMVQHFGADPAAIDSTRVLRLPGFVNNKYEDRPIVRDIAEKVAAKAEYLPADFPTFVYDQRLAIQQNRTKSVDPGSHSKSHEDWRWTWTQLAHGVDPEQVKAALAQMRPDKPNPRYYAEHTVNRAMATMVEKDPGMKQRISAGMGMGD